MWTFPEKRAGEGSTLGSQRYRTGVTPPGSLPSSRGGKTTGGATAARALAAPAARGLSDGGAVPPQATTNGTQRKARALTTRFIAGDHRPICRVAPGHL